MTDPNELWIAAVNETIAGSRRIIDATVNQLSDQELHASPADGINSVAIILRHLGGNLQSRWTDFLTTDGEKPTRQREREFVNWTGDRASLMAYFDQGWSCLIGSMDQLNRENITTIIYIRGEQHSIPQAVARSITHISYHVGQILMVSRMVHQGDWNWLTIAPGQSQQHNEQTWGTAASRSTFGEAKESE
jgi:uncharacterized damage-inducible protein DinB